MTQTSNDPQRTIDRREALRRAALLLVGALSASTVAGVLAGVLAGCEARRTPDGAWTPRALSSDQLDLVATIAEHILPETDTPGARAVGVHRFIDAMLADSFADEERRHFLAGLSDVDARAQRSWGCAFLRCATHEQRAVLDELDREAFAAALDRGAPPFFRTMKELTLVGYYTSEIG